MDLKKGSGRLGKQKGKKKRRRSHRCKVRSFFMKRTNRVVYITGIRLLQMRVYMGGSIKDCHFRFHLQYLLGKTGVWSESLFKRGDHSRPIYYNSTVKYFPLIFPSANNYSTFSSQQMNSFTYWLKCIAIFSPYGYWKVMCWGALMPENLGRRTD